jgi:O-antigen ligase
MAIALFGFVAGAYAAFEKATGQVLFLPKDKFVEDLRLVRGESGIQLIRGLMGSSGTMGRILAFTIPVTFYIFLEYAKTFRFKALLSLMLFFQFWGIIAAMSRTPWYALLSALFVMQLFYAQFRKIFIVIALLSGVVLWATWDQVSDSDVSVRVNDRTEDLNGRTERWNTAQTMWERKPILGWGFNGFSAESGEFRQDGRRDAFGSTESDYWHILVSTGLAGFVPYILFMLATLMNSIRLYVKAHASDWSGFISSQSLTLFWAVILVHLVVSYTATVSNPLLKIFPFAVAGAIVGSHEFLLKGTSAKPVGRPVGPTTVPEQI